MPMKKFRVYTEQVNQDFFDVEARTVASAITKAKQKWRQANTEPRILSVEDEEGNITEGDR